MRSGNGFALIKRWITWTASFIALIGMLPSCSLFEPKMQWPSQRYCAPPSQPPAEPQLPYCRVNFDYPLSAVSRPSLYVYKNERRLLLINDGTLVRDYTIALGPHPNGDKCMRGDGRTPEGEFFICAKNANSKYYKSLGLSYPGPQQAMEAFLAGRISFDEYRLIVESIRQKKLPPSHTALGGAIFIHGGGAETDWTLGCIAVYDNVIDDLFEIIPVGTPVHVMP